MLTRKSKAANTTMGGGLYLRGLEAITFMMLDILDYMNSK
jgi:hypothetical protein